MAYDLDDNEFDDHTDRSEDRSHINVTRLFKEQDLPEETLVYLQGKV